MADPKSGVRRQPARAVRDRPAPHRGRRPSGRRARVGRGRGRPDADPDARRSPAATPSSTWRSPAPSRSATSGSTSPTASACATTRGARASGRASGGTAGSPPASARSASPAPSAANEAATSRTSAATCTTSARYGDGPLVPVRDIQLTSEYDDEWFPTRNIVVVTTDDQSYEFDGDVWSSIPLRNRRDGQVDPAHRRHDPLDVRGPRGLGPLGIPRPGRRWRPRRNRRRTSDGLAAAVAAASGEPVEITELRRLTGGSVARDVVVHGQRGARSSCDATHPAGRSAPGVMRREADAMRACRRAGLRVPEVLADDDGELLGTTGLVMRRVPGETIPRRILRDDAFARGACARSSTTSADSSPVSTPSIPPRFPAPDAPTRSIPSGRSTAAPRRPEPDVRAAHELAGRPPAADRVATR